MSLMSFAPRSLCLSGGTERIQVGSVYGGAEGSGFHVFQASQPLLVGASKGGIAGGFRSGVCLGSGSAAVLGANIDAGFGAGFGGNAAFRHGAGFGGGAVGAAVGILGN